MKLAFKSSNVRYSPTYECHRMVDMVMEAYERFAPEIETLTITSANDSKHMKGSKHYENNALDFRVWGLTDMQRQAIVAYLNERHGPAYQFVDEKDHIHGEYDPPESMQA